MHARHQLGGLLPAAPQSRDLPLVAFGLQARVALPAVRVNRAAGIDAILHKGVQTGSRGILNHPHPNPPGTQSIGLGSDHKALLSVCRPATPSSNPPTIVSSTSTHPLSRSRSGRIIARLSLCSQVQAVS